MCARLERTSRAGKPALVLQGSILAIEWLRQSVLQRRARPQRKYANPRNFI